MHKIIISVFLLFSLNAECASWADIAKGKGRKPTARVAQSIPTQPVTQHNALPANKPEPQFPAIPEHIILLQQGLNALKSNAPAKTVCQIVEPVTSMDVHPMFKSHAHRIVAQACAKEKNTKAELISLCNELSISYNENMLIPHNDQQLFPACNREAVHRLCELFATGHLDEFKNKYQEVADAFAELIMHTGHVTGSRYATHLLAQSAKAAGDYARAVELYALLPVECVQPMHTDITVAKLLHAQTDTQALTELFEEIAADTRLKSTVLTTLCEEQHTHLAQSFWQHIYKTRQGNDKAAAAFELNKILRSTNPKMADIYLSVAASAGNNDACKYAFDLASETIDATQSIKYFEAAALGGHLGAQLRCGTYYKNLTTEQTTKAKDREIYFKNARIFFIKAAEQDSPRAYIELATLAPNIPEILIRLKALADTAAFPLRAEAYQKIGDIYLEAAKGLANEPRCSTEQAKHFDLAENAYKSAALLGYPHANISRAATLVEKAFSTKSPKIKLACLTQAEKLLKKELRENRNATIAAAYLGKLCMHKNDITSSATYFMLAIEKEPNNLDSLNLFSETVDRMRKNKKYGELKTLVTTILERHPECAHAHAALGFVYLEHENNLQAARTAYKKAGKLGYPLGYENLAISYYDEKYNNQNFEKALKYFLKTQEILPTHTKHIILIAKTLLALARYAEAISMLEKGVAINDPNCMITLADCHYKGYAGENSLECAAGLYSRAAALYKQKNPKLEQFCNIMHFIATRKQKNFLPGTPGDAEWLYAFEKLIKELNDYIHIQHLSPLMINEVHSALAAHHMRLARCSNDMPTIKRACLAALFETGKIKDKSPATFFLQIQALMILHQRNLIDTTVPLEKAYTEKFPKLFTKLINTLETHLPTGKMLSETYNLYGQYFELKSKHEEAVLYYKKASVHGSINAALNLFEYYQKCNNESEAIVWLDKINEWVASQPSLDPRRDITQRLLAIIPTDTPETPVQTC